MAEVASRIIAARSRIEPDFTAEREERVRLALGRGIKRQRQKRVAGVAALGALILLLGVFIGRQPSRGPVAQLPERQAISLVELQDGSSVTAASSDARVETVEVGPQQVTLRLETGAARFEVTPDPQRPFRVLAGDVTITVLGTVFNVGLETAGVRVSVERGRVRVAGRTSSSELVAGESTLVSSNAVAIASVSAADLPTAAQPAVPAPAESTAARAAAASPGHASWRALAEDGNYTAALTRLNAEGTNAVRNTPEDLLLAADVARLGGRPERAVAPLQRILSDHEDSLMALQR